MAWLEIDNLSVRIPGRRGLINAVRSVKLQVARGSIHGVIGESGCGKTMTGMSLLGLLPAGAQVSADVMQLEGDDLLACDLAQLRGSRVAMVSQDPAAALNPVLSIARQLDDVIRRHAGLSRRVRRQRAEEMLAACGLTDVSRVLASYPHQLSGGMQQRVVIALALATGAGLLIADEPTTALDATIEAQILALLQRLAHERGLTVLLITHDMNVVARVCDRASVLYAGYTVEDGDVAALLGSPQHPYTQALLAALPRLGSRGQPLAAIDGHIPDPTAAVAGCPFAARCRHAMALCQTLAPSPRRHSASHRSLCHLGAEHD